MSAILFTILLIPAGSNAAAPIHVGSKLVSSVVFPGEMPVVRIELQAPTDSEVKTISPERVLITGSLRVDLLRSDGSRVPGGLPNDGTRAPGSADYIVLDPKQSVTIKAPILARPNKPGDYMVHVILKDVSHDEPTVDVKLPLVCKEIVAAMIRNKEVFVPPDDFGRAAALDQFELLTVEKESGTELIYRRIDSRYGVELLTRLFPLGRKTKVIGTLRKPPDKDATWAELWIALTLDDQLVFCRISTTTGELLEKRVLMASEPK